jgi:hypothetical protein
MTVKDDFYTGLKFAVRCSPLLFPDYAELKSCLVNCDKNKSMLRYFDLDEIVKFIKYVRESGYAESCYFVENYFKDIREITMTSIKLYYLCLLNSIAEPTGLPYGYFVAICDPERSFQRGRLFPVLW